jgi:hypothetical protein
LAVRRPLRRLAAVCALASSLALAGPLGGRPLQSSDTGGGALSLVRVRVTSDADLAKLNSFDLAEARHGDRIDVVAWPGDLPRLRATGLPFEVTVSDLRSTTGPSGYRHLSDYEAELYDLAARFPDHVRLVEGAQRTFEGRTVLGVEIGDDVAADDGRPVAMLLGLHHAREWPSGEMTLDFAKELAEQFGSDPEITDLLRRVKLLAVPVVNPDGFHHSRESVGPVDPEFMGVVGGGQGSYWRKNRRALELGEVGVATHGVDPNRNYGQQWGSGGPLMGSTSSNPFDQTYQGKAPFSEPESANVRQWILTRGVTAFVTNHTYSNLVLWPWGWTRNDTPESDLLERIGEEYAAFNDYKPMQSSHLYRTTGTTEDWAYATAGVLGFTFEHGRAFHPEHERNYPPLYDKNRGAFRHLLRVAADEANHAVITGRVVDAGQGVPARLRLVRTGSLELDPGNPSGLREITDVIDIGMTTGPDGGFRWHVNPSTPPLVTEDAAYQLTVTLRDGRTRTLPVSVGRGESAGLGDITF